MSAPGWYPDPGGQKGMFRYWDGQAWSQVVSPTPNAGSPGGVGPGGVGPGGVGPGGGFDPTRPLHGQGGGPGPAGFQPGRPGGGAHRIWWVAGIAAALALVLLVAWGVRQVADTVTGGGSPRPSGQSTRETCPRTTASPGATPGARTGGTRDGRVYGGKLSYPMLPAPWSAPAGDTRVPFGQDVHHQAITIEQNTNPTYDWTGWVASVLVARLVAGDGFYTPQQGSEIVVTCIVGSFYGNSKVTRRDTVNRATTVGGKEAWLVESQLGFDIKGLKTKGELLIVMIVATGDGEASLFYASIPDTSPQWIAPARQAMADLRVEG